MPSDNPSNIPKRAHSSISSQQTSKLHKSFKRRPTVDLASRPPQAVNAQNECHSRVSIVVNITKKKKEIKDVRSSLLSQRLPDEANNLCAPATVPHVCANGDHVLHLGPERRLAGLRVTARAHHHTIGRVRARGCP